MMKLKYKTMILPSGTTIEYPDPTQFPTLPQTPAGLTLEERIKKLEESIALMDTNIKKLLPPII